MVKEFLSQKNISFQERDVSRNQAYAQELASSTGQMGVPVIIMDNETIIGFDRARLEQIISQKQSTRKPLFGAAIADAVKITAKQGGEVVTGAYIGSVRPGSFAARTGLMPGDIITEINALPVTNAEDLAQLLSTFSQGSHVAISFRRGVQPLNTEGIYKN
jgi:membrane-associated protease RseP (regulator of RpoE activity)